MSLPSPQDACARARERASLRVDGDLSLLETVSLHGHLRSCAECRAFAAGIERVASELRSTPLAVASAAAAAVLIQVSPGNLPSGPEPAARSDAALLRANYAEQKLARLFLNGELATRVQHTASLLN